MSERCDFCRKKVGILGLKCKCDKLFCTSHLQPEIHACTMDYRNSGLENLKKKMEIGALKDKMSERI
jgi:hypothetical protein